MKKKIALISTALACSCLVNLASAQNYFDDEFGVDLTLKNEFRRAQKPSAGVNDQIGVWVQGVMLKLDSGWLNDYIGMEGGYYYVAKLAAPESMSTRWYLDDWSNFGFWTAAVKFRYQDLVKLKLGRFETDYSHDALPYEVPLINSNSTRTMPTTSQGALLMIHPHENIDIWGMYRNQVFTATSALQGGFRDEGVYRAQFNDYDQRDRYFAAVSFYDSNYRLSLGYSYQDDVAHIYQADFDYTFKLDNEQKINTKLRYFGGRAIGESKDLSERQNKADSTNLYALKVSWFNDYGIFNASLGYLSDATNGQVIDADMGFVNSLSLDRTHDAMFACELGYAKPLGGGFTVALAPIMTRGYEDLAHKVEVHGYSLNYGVMYQAPEGSFKDLSLKLFGDWGFEKRDGSKYGDRLNYWDIKMTIQYNFDFLS